MLNIKWTLLYVSSCNETRTTKNNLTTVINNNYNFV